MFPIDIDFSRLKEVLTYDPQAPMIFSSGIFLWLFAAFMVVYVLLQRKYTARIMFVTLFSYYFYYKSSGTYFFLLAIVTVADFFLAQLMDRAEGYWKRKGLVALSLGVNLGLLVYFKYTNFLGGVIASLMGGEFTALDIFLPVGISFFTFQSLSYTIDVYRKEIKPLTDAEIPLFLQAIKGLSMENAYALCLFAGLREGECLGLSWEQVDFKAQRITISQQLQKEKKKNAAYYIAPSTKSGKPRQIEPPEIAFQYLRAERKRQAENRLAAGELWNNPDDLVFTDAMGGHLRISTFYKTFKRIAESIGRPDARPHDLRHTAATVAIAAGADIKSVQDLLGHATASFTLNVYAHTSDQMKKDTAARMQNYYDNLTAKKA